MPEVNRRLALLFLLAAAGVLVMFGAVLGRLAGAGAAAVYGVTVLAAALVLAVAARRRLRAQRRASGRTCSCCAGTVHDPVQVI